MVRAETWSPWTLVVAVAALAVLVVTFAVRLTVPSESAIVPVEDWRWTSDGADRPGGADRLRVGRGRAHPRHAPDRRPRHRDRRPPDGSTGPTTRSTRASTDRPGPPASWSRSGSIRDGQRERGPVTVGSFPVGAVAPRRLAAPPVRREPAPRHRLPGPAPSRPDGGPGARHRLGGERGERPALAGRIRAERPRPRRAVPRRIRADRPAQPAVLDERAPDHPGLPRLDAADRSLALAALGRLGRADRRPRRSAGGRPARLLIPITLELARHLGERDRDRHLGGPRPRPRSGRSSPTARPRSTSGDPVRWVGAAFACGAIADPRPGDDPDRPHRSGHRRRPVDSGTGPADPDRPGHRHRPRPPLRDRRPAPDPGGDGRRARGGAAAPPARPPRRSRPVARGDDPEARGGQGPDPRRPRLGRGAHRPGHARDPGGDRRDPTDGQRAPSAGARRGRAGRGDPAPGRVVRERGTGWRGDPLRGPPAGRSTSAHPASCRRRSRSPPIGSPSRR